jgi:two-component system phosphate regulon response regulator PhoB
VKILIIVDATSVLRELGYTLGALDYDIVSAESAQEGLSKTVREHPDLVIVDSDLPDMPGTDVCRELRRRPETSDVPIIMLGSSRLPADQNSGLKAGANAYVTKPFEADEVVAELASIGV